MNLPQKEDAQTNGHSSEKARWNPLLQLLLICGMLEQTFENTAADNSKTGYDQPATQKQKDFVATLADQAHKDVSADDMTRGEASEAIDKLKPQANAKEVRLALLLSAD
jgi:hypothetical protein